jgi:hypothetical protein
MDWIYAQRAQMKSRGKAEGKIKGDGTSCCAKLFCTLGKAARIGDGDVPVCCKATPPLNRSDADMLHHAGMGALK